MEVKVPNDYRQHVTTHAAHPTLCGDLSISKMREDVHLLLGAGSWSVVLKGPVCLISVASK